MSWAKNTQTTKGQTLTDAVQTAIAIMEHGSWAVQAIAIKFKMPYKEEKTVREHQLLHKDGQDPDTWTVEGAELKGWGGST